eukprot:COSAG02_NODE_6648_length_3437_cov_1.548232_2_plen_185_part_00
MVPTVQPERALALLYRTLYPSGSWDGAHPSDPLVITLDLPNSTASAVGSSATFELEVEGATPPYIYEWFLSAPDAAARVLPQCVGSRCTLSSLRLTDSGRQVYCEIKGTEGMSVRSRASELQLGSGVVDQIRAAFNAAEASGSASSVMLGVVIGAVVACCMGRCCGGRAEKKGYAAMKMYTGGD